MSGLSNAEYERRHRLLQELLASEQLDALVLAANDYRGHKGTLRWIADYHLPHRYGYAVVLPDAPPVLVLPENLALTPRRRPDVPVRCFRRVADGLIGELRPRAPRRIGVVGLNQVMKVEDYRALTTAFPDAELVDVDRAFEFARAVKSAEELEGFAEATRIGERCFERLLEVAAPGVTERAINAEVTRVALAEGGEDLLFLTMYGEPRGDGRVDGRFAPPHDRELRAGETHTFSFEIIGPLGYWMELARMVTVGPPTELQLRINAAVDAGITAGIQALRPGVDPGDAQRKIVAAIEQHGARSAYWSGHGLGQDVLEEPWIGLDMVDDRPTAGMAIREGMALALHPFVIDDDERAIGYMADTLIVGAQETTTTSTLTRDIWSIS